MSAVSAEMVAIAVSKAGAEKRVQEAQWVALFYSAGRAAEALERGDTDAARHWLNEASDAEWEVLRECELFGPLLDALGGAPCQDEGEVG